MSSIFRCFPTSSAWDGRNGPCALDRWSTICRWGTCSSPSRVECSWRCTWGRGDNGQHRKIWFLPCQSSTNKRKMKISYKHIKNNRFSLFTSLYINLSCTHGNLPLGFLVAEVQRFLEKALLVLGRRTPWSVGWSWCCTSGTLDKVHMRHGLQLLQRSSARTRTKIST